MASYDTLRHVSIGQYVPTGSVIHRLDPRTKLLGLLLGIVALLTAQGYLVNLALMVLVLGLVRLARLPLRFVLATVRPGAAHHLDLGRHAGAVLRRTARNDLAGMGAAAHLFLWGGADGRLAVAVRRPALPDLASDQYNHRRRPDPGRRESAAPPERAGTPRPRDRADRLDRLAFLPILGEQMEAIIQAQRSRGALVDHGRWAIVANARRAAQLIVPLLVDAYRRADELVLAMRARCYRGGDGRTHLIQLVFAGRDWIALFAGLALVALAIGLRNLPIP